MALSSSQLRTKKVAVETSDLFGGGHHVSPRGFSLIVKNSGYSTSHKEGYPAKQKNQSPPKKEDFNQMAQMSISQL